MSTFNTTNYRVYAKFIDQKTFKALDLTTGCQVNNLIRATIIPAENLQNLISELQYVSDGQCILQIRDLNNNIVH